MARDFEDLNDLDDLNDDELRGLVREHLAAHNGLDIDDLTIEAHDGRVILAGRVGTDGERLVAEHIVTDVLGILNYRNDIFVDPTRRATSPEAVDESIVDDDLREGLLLGDRAVTLTPEVEEPDAAPRRRPVRQHGRPHRHRRRHPLDSARAPDAGRHARPRRDERRSLAGSGKREAGSG